jgi:hypothetical protein
MNGHRDTNSKRTRIEPIFRWLTEHGDPDWADKLLRAAEGFVDLQTPGKVRECHCDKEITVSPSPQRLAWMIRNADRLAPVDGRLWQNCTKRIRECADVDKVLTTLDAGKTTDVPATLKFETATHADCLIRCETAIIWVEGKRNDWLSPSTKWDVARDQLARNVEAASILARQEDKDYWVLICYESILKHHEERLLQGYRSGSWVGGWPHVSDAQRKDFARKIGTIRWATIAGLWPEVRSLKPLQDINTP